MNTKPLIENAFWQKEEECMPRDELRALQLQKLRSLVARVYASVPAYTEALDKAGVTVNKNAVPFDTQSPMVTSGIRIGTPAVTTRGLREGDMKTLASWIDRTIRNIDDEAALATIRAEVLELCSRHPLYADL